MIPLVTILFISLAAFFKAIADTLAHHYDNSIFRKLPYQFWDANMSWKYIKIIPFTGYRPDAWHLSNSAMIISFIMGIVFYKPHYAWWIELLASGILFNIVFGIFYKLFRRSI